MAAEFRWVEIRFSKFWYVLAVVACWNLLGWCTVGFVKLRQLWKVELGMVVMFE
jgi:hypothetical protein